MTDKFMLVNEAMQIVYDLALQNITEDEGEEQERQNHALGVVHDLMVNVFPDGEERDVKVWKIEVEIHVGEYEHSEELFFYGSESGAWEYANDYMLTVWGEGETTWSKEEQAWMSPGGRRAARLSGVTPFEDMSATDKNGKARSLVADWWEILI